MKNTMENTMQSTMKKMMKKLPFLALFVGLLLANNLAAQELPKEIFDPAACGCAVIDIDKITQNDTNHIKSISVNKELLLAQFKAQNNTTAIAIIEDLLKIDAKTDLKTKIDKSIGSLSDKKDRKKEEWLTTFNAIAEKAKGQNTDKVSLYIACQFAEDLHSYYFQYPEEAGTPKAKAFYSAQKKPIPTQTPNPNASALADGSDKIATAAGDKNDSTPWLWIIISISLGLFSFYLLSARPKQNNNNPVDNLNRDLEAAKAENQKLRNQLAEKERELLGLSSRNNELKKRLDDFERQQQQQQQININTNPQPNTTQNMMQNTMQSAIRRYLSAPTSDGSFASNSIKNQADGEAFYVLDLAQESSSKAEFKLILKPEIIHRAETMVQQYLLPACDMKGTGRLPQDISQIKMTAGELVREGQGWRVSKKIILTW